MKSINKVILLLLISGICYSQDFLKTGINLVEFNTGWNKENHCEYLKEIKDCKIYEVTLCDYPQYMEELDIKVPAIVLYNEGKEIIRFEANILFEFDCTKKEIQKEVDKLILSKFN
tara:strand:+ start:4585 stop:4932 length:348 start_codon:yes stop_codon:yes gene_type:complete